MVFATGFEVEQPVTNFAPFEPGQIVGAVPVVIPYLASGISGSH